MEPLVDYQTELLREAQSRYHFSPAISEAYEAIPRHDFVHEKNMALVYADYPMSLFEKNEQVSTISQPSFVLKMIDMLDIQPGMNVFELGAGSGWNAALMGHIVGKRGLIKSYEIIPEMVEYAKANLRKFDLPQVEIIQGDALEAMVHEIDFDRGIFTAGAWDMPGSLFDMIKVGGKLLFVLKTSAGDLLLAMERKEDHFEVYDRLECRFVSVTGASMGIYHNDLSELYFDSSPMTIWPQGTINLSGRIVAGRDMLYVQNNKGAH